MNGTLPAVARAAALAALTLVAVRGTALGHTTGDSATPEHVLLEVAGWGLGLATLLGVIVLGFWIRAKQRKE